MCFERGRWHNFGLHVNSLPFTAFPQKQVLTQLVKKFPSFYGTRRFITVFARSNHWSLSWARYIHSTTSHPISLRPILILSSHLRLVFRLVSSLQVFQPEFWMHFSSLSCAPRALHPLTFLDLIILILFDEMYKLWTLSLSTLLQTSAPCSQTLTSYKTNGKYLAVLVRKHLVIKAYRTTWRKSPLILYLDSI